MCRFHFAISEFNVSGSSSVWFYFDHSIATNEKTMKTKLTDWHHFDTMPFTIDREKTSKRFINRSKSCPITLCCCGRKTSDEMKMTRAKKKKPCGKWENSDRRKIELDFPLMVVLQYPALISFSLAQII